MIKKHYEAPATLVFEVKTEGVICQSGLNDPNDYNNGGNPFSTSMMPKFEDFGFKWQEEWQ